MRLPDLISTGFIALSTVYLICAFLVLSHDIRAIKRRLLFISFLCFSWWAFAFALANNALDAETAILWRRLASIGWGSVFCFLLHYALLLTGFKPPLEKRLVYFIIYLPAVINVLLYGVLDSTALFVYQMQKTQTGWVNIAELSALNIPHFISNTGFPLLIVGLLLYWGIKTEDKTIRKTGLVIGFTSLFGAILGTMTEYAIKTVFNIAFPQLGPLAFIFTAFVLFYYSRKNGLILQIPKENESSDSLMLSESAQDRLFLYIALGSIVGGFLVFADLFIAKRTNLVTSVAISGALLLIAVTICLTRKLQIKAESKDLVVGIVLALSLIGISVLKYRLNVTHALLLHSLYVLLAIVFASKKIMFMIVASVFVSLIISWKVHPVMEISFTSIDHGIRIAIVAIMVSFAVIINHYLKKALADSRKKAKMEKFLSDMATMFMATDEENFDSNLNQILVAWGGHHNADCIRVIFIDVTDPESKSGYQWSKTITNKSVLIMNIDKDSLLASLFGLRHIWDKDYASHANDMSLSEIAQTLSAKIISGNLTVLPLKNLEKLIGLVVIEKHTIAFAYQEEQHRTNNIAARMLADVWIRIESYKKMWYNSSYDSLTSLPNRQHFAERVKQAINMASRTDKLIGICFIDIDSFKYINDTMGHKVGDKLLRKIVQRIKENIREYDVAARFGGDEFLIMIPQVDDVSNIEKIAIRVLQGIEMPLVFNEQSLIISASMGISVFPHDGLEYGELLKNADIALYVSKENGKGKHIFCTESIKKESHINNTLINDLNWALEKNEIFLHYQPVIQVSDEKIIGAEALLRWRHPEFGLISPHIFIALAERSGLISKIGNWVVYEACMQNKRWQDIGFEPMIVGINLSLVQFFDENLVEVVRDALETTGLDPCWLELEITESVSIQSSQNVAQKIDQLKEIGVKVAIDDFGSGFSSFGRLNSMHVDKLKIDMQFVHGINCNKTDEEIIKAITQLGKTLNIKILAEGVEDESQLSFLKENLCDEIQGFHFYKPMDASSIERILSEQSEVVLR